MLHCLKLCRKRQDSTPVHEPPLMDAHEPRAVDFKSFLKKNYADPPVPNAAGLQTPQPIDGHFEPRLAFLSVASPPWNTPLDPENGSHATIFLM